MRVLKFGVIVIIMLQALVACSSLSNSADETEGLSAQELYTQAKRQLDLGDYGDAIELYEKLESRYPFGDLALQAQLDVAYAYYRAEEPASAIAAAERFIKLHPRHPNVDYAYYLRGLVSFNEGRGLIDRIVGKEFSELDPASSEESFESFAELVRRYPNSVYAADATQRMVFLKNTLARYELHVADYYVRREAYLAAANRARYVVENYQRTPAVPDALALMVKAYGLLGLEDLAEDSRRVLKLNYPDYDERAVAVTRAPVSPRSIISRTARTIRDWFGRRF